MDTNRSALISVCFLFGSGALIANAQPPKITLIEAGRVLDVHTGAYLNHQGILVENERIRDVGDFPAVRNRAPKDTVVIDLRNATLLPGLIDCHAHLLAGWSVRLPAEALTLALAQMSPSERAL